MDMNFTLEKIDRELPKLRRAVRRAEIDIPSFKMFVGECPQAHRPDFDDRDWADFTVGSTWGGYDVTAWFRATVAIPEGLRSKKLALRFLVGPRDGGGSTAETLLYVNGAPLQGIDVWHEEAWLPPEVMQSGEIQIALKCWSGVLDIPPVRHFKLAQLIWTDEPAEQYYALVTALSKAAKVLDEHDLNRVRLVQAINRSYQLVDWLNPQSDACYRSIVEALAWLQSALEADRALHGLTPTVVGIGHSHIDMAWLWRLRHSREKASRTFSTALHLMRQYPEYRFMHSSPQLYKFLKQDYPEIFARVKEKIQSGEWEVTGGMWVEADTNLTSGESLIRQFLYGRRFTRQEFGVEMNLLWLPDVFGYSAALPQIARKSGMKYFLTTKISWSQYNRFPYDTFRWRGIDGTELLTHFVTTAESGSPIYTYNGLLDPAETQGIWENYRQKEINDRLLMLFGWGDGGGGPTKEMLDSAQVLKDVPGLPRVELGKAEPYFAGLEARLAGQDVPVWDGELYLEYHRGTYTSQAQIKRANRKAEILYHNAEWLSAAADILLGIGQYPAEALHEGWEKILLNQFHDILPGSSIRQVYEDSQADYAAVEMSGQAAVSRALNALAREIPAAGPTLLALNPLSFARSGLVELPYSEELAKLGVADANGERIALQAAERDGQATLLAEFPAVPALGYAAQPLLECRVEAVPAEAMVNKQVLWQNPESAGNASIYDLQPAGQNGNGTHSTGLPHPTIPLDPAIAVEIVATNDRLENRFYRIQFNANGQIASLWDKRHQREVLASGQAGNVFQVFEDRPMNFDAWDIDLFYREKMRLLESCSQMIVEEAGPLRATLRLRWTFDRSTITQRVSIYRASPRIDFRTEVDWHERQTLLKVAFPVDIRATRATYDIQFGALERPTHWNTSWDKARFEAVGHKWVDLSEGDYGVALLNDCKYGHDVKDNVLRLTLIKSAIDPDPEADQGRHEFTYSLLPHAGDWRHGRVIEEGYALNNPLLAHLIEQAQTGSLPGNWSLAQVSAPNVILETVKQAEDEDGAWIFRVYESQQCRHSNVTLRFGRPVSKAVACNLVEEGDQPVNWTSEGITFDIRPFEIQTFKVWF